MVSRPLAAAGGVRAHRRVGDLRLYFPGLPPAGCSVPGGRDRPGSLHRPDGPGVGVCHPGVPRPEQAGADGGGHGGLCKVGGAGALPRPVPRPRRPHQAPALRAGRRLCGGQSGAGLPGGLSQPPQRPGKAAGLVALGHHRGPGRGQCLHSGQRQGAGDQPAAVVWDQQKRGGLVAALGEQV